MNSEIAIKAIAMPADTNPDGDMFGGWIVSQMDLAGYLTARKLAKNKLVTVAIDDIIFHNPVFIGDAVECRTTVEKIGRSSITIKVEAWVERKEQLPGEEKARVTEGRFVFVAIGKDRKPVEIDRRL